MIIISIVIAISFMHCSQPSFIMTYIAIIIIINKIVITIIVIAIVIIISIIIMASATILIILLMYCVVWVRCLFGRWVGWLVNSLIGCLYGWLCC